MHSIACGSREVTKSQSGFFFFFQTSFFSLSRSCFAAYFAHFTAPTSVQFIQLEVPLFSRDDFFFPSPTTTVCDHFTDAHKPLRADFPIEHRQRHGKCRHQRSSIFFLP
jgi:hypothetical protein